jgi:hypothetical protein
LRRQPGFDGFNSFRMAGNGQMLEEPELQRRLLATPVLYFSDAWSFYSDTIRRPELLDADPAHLFFPASERKLLSDAGLARTGSEARFKSFSPHEIIAETVSGAPCYLTLKQHYHPAWKATVDGKPVTVHRSNYLFMTLSLPPGRHEVVYRFEPPAAGAAFGVSLASFALCLLLLAWPAAAPFSQAAREGGRGV